jgi:predicted dehydrogenase
MPERPAKSTTTTGPARLGRRRFLKSTALAGAGLTILPSGALCGPNAPSNKLNIALIGSWGRAKAHYGAVKPENVVALCDIDEKHIAIAAKEFPGAKEYVDWRKCLDQKDLDAVVCSTTDFTHAFVSCWALNRDLHIYCEKPLGNTVEEARVTREKFLAKKNKLATQVGTQRHAHPNFNRVREMVLDGAVGTLKHVHAWGNRQLRRDGYLPPEGEPPEHLHYDLWIGPVPFHPYNPGYFSRGPGANCLSWNMYWDFGSGQVGDMGSHTMDLAWNAIDAGLPTGAKAHGEEFNPEVTPVELTTTFEHPANDWRPGIKVTWYQGGHMPKNPPGYDLNKIGHGVMFEGDKGYLVASFRSHELLPVEGGDLSHYKPRPKEEQIPDMGGFQQQWINACKGDLKTSCDFEYSGTAIEQMLLGLVAYRVGKPLDYDPKTGKVTNSSEGNDLLGKKYREGWVLDG